MHSGVLHSSILHSGTLIWWKPVPDSSSFMYSLLRSHYTTITNSLLIDIIEKWSSNSCHVAIKVFDIFVTISGLNELNHSQNVFQVSITRRTCKSSILTFRSYFNMCHIIRHWYDAYYILYIKKFYLWGLFLGSLIIILCPDSIFRMGLFIITSMIS